MAQSSFAPNTVARRLTWLALLVVAACSGSSAPTALPPRPKPPCEVAAELRAIVPRVLNEGKLHRTARIIEKANRLCAATAAETRAAERSVSTARLARLDEARPPAETITPEARMVHAAADRAAAEGKREEAIALYEKAWEAWPRNGRALMSAGLLAKQLGRMADAQRLFDRATAVLEAATGSTITADVPKEPLGVSDVVWSRDGKAVAVVQGDTVSILDTDSWRPHLRLPGHGSRVVGTSFSPDGKRITVVADDAKVQSWDVPSGSPVGAFQAPGDFVFAAAFSPHGERIALGVSGGTVRLVDAISGALVRTLGPVRARPASSDLHEVISVAFSPDGNVIASGMTHERVVRLWDATTGALRLELEEPRMMMEESNAGVESVAFSSDGKRVTAGSIVWDSTTGAPLYRLEEYDPQLAGRVVFSPDGKRIAGEIPGKDTIMLWDGPTGDPLRVLPRSSSAFSFSPDGKHLVTAEGGGNVELWDVETGVPAKSRGSAPEMRTLAFSTATKRVASGLADGTVQLWQADNGAPRVLHGHTASVTAIAFSPDGERLASASADTTVRLWDTATGAPLFTLRGHGDTVGTVVFSPDGERLASASSDKTVRLWNPRAGTQLALLGGHAMAVFGVAFSADGKRLATTSNGTLRRWDVATGALRDEKKSSPVVLSRVALSPDGNSIASVFGNTVRLMNSVDGPVLMTLGKHPDAVNDVAFSPDGKSIAAAVSDGSVELWDAETGAALATFGGHRSKVIVVAFSPTSPILWSGSDDGEIRLRGLPSGSPMVTLGAVAGKRAAYYVAPAGAVDFVGADACSARDLAVCRIGPHVFPFDVCEERFYAPGFFGKILAGDPVSLDSDPEIEPALLSSCPITPDVTPPPFTALPLPKRKVCRPPILPNPKGVLSPGDLEGPYTSSEEPRSPDLEHVATRAPLLLGFDAKRGRGAAIVIDQVATAGEGCPHDVRGEIFDLRTGRLLSREALGQGGRCEALEQATTRYAAGLPKLGFSPARNLVDRVTQRYADDGFTPLAVLDSPLCGWMIHVKANEAQRRFSIALVSPANDERYELGSLPFGDACIVYDERKRCVLPGVFRYPSVHEVALTPDRSRLYVSIGATPGGHNDPIRFHRGVFVLPRGVLSSHENGASQ